MISVLKKMIQGERRRFLELCRCNNLGLDYQINKNEIVVLKAIFENREYSNYFPFYQKVTIIDIGAHYGYFSIFAKNNTDESSKIIAIEPNKSNFKQLKKNIEDCKINNISSFNYAIAGRAGVRKLYVGKSPNHSIVENYSLLTQHSSFEEIECKTLEGIIIENNLEKIDFLKIDCEGAEYSVLEHTAGYVFDKITTISMEFHDLKDNKYTGIHLIKILIEHGFEIVKYEYEKTSRNLNYGKIIGTKIYKNLKG